MRALAISVLAIGCGQGDDERGRLICQADGKVFATYVRRGDRAAVTTRAEAAQLTACRFEPGPPVITHALPPAEPIPSSSPRSASAVSSVPPTALEPNRLAGQRTVVPDAATQLEIRRRGRDKVIGSYQLCITEEGEVSTVSQLKSTGFAAYDGKILREMRTWRYLPYIQGGAPAAVCTAVSFRFALPDP